MEQNKREIKELELKKEIASLEIERLVLEIELEKLKHKEYWTPMITMGSHIPTANYGEPLVKLSEKEE